ncbi:MAG TPA: gamma-glutamyl-gamma-aminobutyrate hydrolase family protein [candidate division Zixibacteria bacterium]|jgi:putative glutamine amidotransferase
MNKPETKRPLICLTVRGKPFDAERHEPTTAPFEWITNAYSALVSHCGGVPLLLSNECPPADVARIVGLTHGLLLTGGEDMAPRYFGEKATVDNLTINEARDAVELSAIAAADAVGMPIFGICRGAQVLNIARGGSVYQDLAQTHPTPVRDHSRGPSRTEVGTHRVELEADSHLRRVMGHDRVDGASDHHQAINKLGRGLWCVARSPEDGVIEAVEERGERFVVGVQWHPEARPNDDASQRIFDAFVDAARTFAQQSTVRNPAQMP